MAEKLIEEKIAKKSTHSFYDVKEENSGLYDQINKQATNALFDNSHKTDKLQKVYEEIDRNQEKVEVRKQKYDDFNPFFGDKNALEKMASHNYKEVVEKKDEPSEVLEIKQEIDVKPISRKQKEHKLQRKHLWITTISVCLVLFAFVFGYNMFSINSLAKNTAKTQHKISQTEQQMAQTDAQYEEFKGAITDMEKAQNSGASTVDLSPQNTTPRYTEKSSAWDRFCDFFAGLFGK